MGDWFVVETANGLVLDISEGEQGGKLIVFTRHGGDNQLWRLEDGRLVNKTGMVADIADSNREEGPRLLHGRKMVD